MYAGLTRPPRNERGTFSQECKVLSMFQNLFLDHYRFFYKLPMEWSPPTGQLVLVKRRYSYFFDRLPLLFGFLIIFCGLLGARGLTYYNSFLAPSPLTSNFFFKLQIQICLASVVLGLTLFGGHTFICIKYVHDLHYGLNHLLKLYYAMEHQQYRSWVLPARNNWVR